MKQNQIDELPTLDPENMENMFNVYQDTDGMYYYNLLKTVEFPDNLPIILFDNYTTRYGDTWPFISFKTYNNPNLWWVILLANKIHNPLTPIPNGRNISIPKNSVVREILEQIGKT